MDELMKVGRGEPKRPVVMALVRTYRMVWHANARMPVYAVMGEVPVRVRRYGWDASGRAVEVTATEVHHTALPEVAASGAERPVRGPARPPGPRQQPRRQTRSQRRGRHSGR
jgi:hypothetical protein